MTGRISAAFASVSNVIQLIEAGKLTALAIAQPTRSALLPDTPTIDEAGLPGVHASIWIGMLAPSGTPRQIVERLSRIINEALKTEEVASQLRLQGMEVLGGSPQEFEQRIKKDTAGWDVVLRVSGAGK
jgi:tripartite-type tricarboxylate transporter receptor subunit TctC